MNENECEDEIVFDCETIAWKILMDDEMDMGKMLTWSPDDGEDDPASYMFELLINIMMEMIYGMLLIDAGDGEFNPEISCEKFKDIMPILEEKLRKVSILMHLHSYKSGECDGVVDGRYCRIIMRHNENDKSVFGLYEVPEGKHFHFLRNPGYNVCKNLRDVYGICTIGNVVYSIGFSQV